MVFKVGIAGLGKMGTIHHRVLNGLVSDIPDLKISTYDPISPYSEFSREEDFYSSGQDLFVVAMGPENRESAVRYLSGTNAMVILEKPVGFVEIKNGELKSMDLDSIVANLSPDNTIVHFPELWDGLSLLTKSIIEGDVEGIPPLSVHE